MAKPTKAISEVLDIFEGMLDQLLRAIKKEITRLFVLDAKKQRSIENDWTGQDTGGNDRTECAEEIEGFLAGEVKSYLGSDDPDNAKLDQFIPNNQEAAVGPKLTTSYKEKQTGRDG
ncbi:hypothetical protein PPACK8108_LOCUS7811 [Phakopsora pachyrhizi]|uniref:Uncharacterized protein n=1 Tax=Phakopsora pachyrhizi TaxID=170000 RepID=A0AAV0AU47_PHAPC|nr:hypothetical protein PPACK8108_LOCUS7811 [Phakopsora pachyrhizi]